VLQLPYGNRQHLPEQRGRELFQGARLERPGHPRRATA
jgi:hypothetical protein